MVAPFATTGQLADFLQREFDPSEYDAADQALALASAAIRATIGQILDQTTDTAVVLDATGSGTLVLPESPVTAISSVEVLSIDGLTWTALAYPADYRWNSAGILRRVSAADPDMRFSPFVWPAQLGSVRVTYTHGYATIPLDLQSVAVSAAARLFTNPLGILTEQIGTYQVRYGPNLHGVTFTDAELATLGRYRSVTVA